MVHEPSVKMGIPNNESSFDLYKAGDIDVYVLAGLKARNDQLSITFRKFLWSKNLYAEGLIINQI